MAYIVKCFSSNPSMMQDLLLNGHLNRTRAFLHQHAFFRTFGIISYPICFLYYFFIHIHHSVCGIFVGLHFKAVCELEYIGSGFK